VLRQLFHGWLLAAIVLPLGVLQATDVHSEAVRGLPLPEQIDALIEQQAIGPLAPPCSDEEFLRRVSLDLTGIIPSVAEIDEFLGDRATDRRARWVDRLLSSPAFARHMAMEFHVMLLERRDDKAVSLADWELYLIRSLDANKPLDQLFRELIFMEGEEPADRIPAKFILNRASEPNAVTRDIGRLAFGMDLQCAQCHDHPLISDYEQQDYYRLYAFWNRTSLFTDPESKALLISEQADGEANFTSVFTGEGGEGVVPRPPRGAAVVAEPITLNRDAYTVAPSKSTPGKPKYSRRRALAERLAGNPQFQRNIANRVWSLMFGRGIVHPLDLHHSQNPPWNPQLLQFLAETLVAEGYQLRPMLRALALTRAYQRSCEAPSPTSVNFHDIAARRLQVQAEMAAHAPKLQQAAEELQLRQQAYEELLQRQAKLRSQLPSLLKKGDELQAKAGPLVAQVRAAEKVVAGLEKQEAVMQKAVATSAAAMELDKEDRELPQIVKQLEAKLAKLGEGRSTAAGKLEAARQAAAVVEAEAAQAAQAVSQLEKQQVQPAELTPVERAYGEAMTRYEQLVYQGQADEQLLKIGDLAAEYVVANREEPAKAESLWQSLIEQWTSRHQIAALRPLSSEQLTLSLLQATGNLDRQLEAARAKLAAKPPAVLKNAAEGERKSLEAQCHQAAIIEQLRAKLNQFASLYGGLPGEEFQATVNQALFFGNGEVLDEWLQPTSGNLIEKLAGIKDHQPLADYLYRATLSRSATLEECEEIAAMLQQSDGQEIESLRQLGWALLSSTEFRFNH
jgi:hypothetical protein